MSKNLRLILQDEINHGLQLYLIFSKRYFVPELVMTLE
ncbi:hypothetical protein T4A_4255 [Trichinella pseudospiralis]|uniref:Uncharacterized protein n=1 Tax=Trichinella pseudospiralis TaxID=6337 RepID=A0A0V1DJB4_TRIPS|nr:hypothetical protein T4A_4255 [Trichinella pseudospiralis]